MNPLPMYAAIRSVYPPQRVALFRRGELAHYASMARAEYGFWTGTVERQRIADAAARRRLEAANDN